MIKLEDKSFEIGKDISFKIFNGKDGRFKLYIGKLHDCCKTKNSITISDCEVSRENFDGLLTVNIDKCTDFNYVEA